MPTKIMRRATGALCVPVMSDGCLVACDGGPGGVGALSVANEAHVRDRRHAHEDLIPAIIALLMTLLSVCACSTSDDLAGGGGAATGTTAGPCTPVGATESHPTPRDCNCCTGGSCSQVGNSDDFRCVSTATTTTGTTTPSTSGSSGCDPGLTKCDGVCVDTDTDVNNCHGCGNVCSLPNAQPFCGYNGLCGIESCNANWGDCDFVNANGCEADLLEDANNCSACGQDCGNTYCHLGQCGSGTTTTGSGGGCSPNPDGDATCAGYDANFPYQYTCEFQGDVPAGSCYFLDTGGSPVVFVWCCAS